MAQSQLPNFKVFSRVNLASCILNSLSLRLCGGRGGESLSVRRATCLTSRRPRGSEPEAPAETLTLDGAGGGVGRGERKGPGPSSHPIPK